MNSAQWHSPIGEGNLLIFSTRMYWKILAGKHMATIRLSLDGRWCGTTSVDLDVQVDLSSKTL